MDHLRQPKPGKFQPACSVFVTGGKVTQRWVLGKVYSSTVYGKLELLLPSLFELPYHLWILEENLIKQTLNTHRIKADPDPKSFSIFKRTTLIKKVQEEKKITNYGQNFSTKRPEIQSLNPDVVSNSQTEFGVQKWWAFHNPQLHYSCRMHSAFYCSCFHCL